MNRGGAISPRHPLKRVRLVLFVVAASLFAVIIGWRFLVPENKANVPAELPESDKREIVALLRGFTVRHAFGALGQGNVREFVRCMKISRQQRINRFIDDHDGTFRAYTVVDSPRDTDGWYAWSRHSLCKSNGHWVILRSF